MKKFTFFIPFLFITLLGYASTDIDYSKALRQLAKEKIAAWSNDPIVISAIKAQNKKHAALSQGEIDTLDKQWRSETKSSNRPLIASILSKNLSKYLSKIKSENQGLYTEIFVMVNKGLNVGQSDVTSDYWQGDEAKWKDTYNAGPGAVHVGKVKKDESTQLIQSQVSISITDPSTNSVIGAITIGVNLDNL